MERYLTPKQHEIMQYIRGYIQDNKISPTVREIAEATYSSQSYAYDCLSKLEELGYLTWQRYKYRTIVLTEDNHP